MAKGHTRDKGYGQHCPIAIAAEVIAERWTPLVLRALCLGATRFGEIQESVPRMSPALLTRRLRDLERAGVVRRAPEGGYRLTEPGRELFPVLEAMGFWAQKWLRREIVRDENLNPDVLMWELRRAARNAGRRTAGRRTAGRRVVEFLLDGVPVAKRFYWLVFQQDDVEICVKDPGYPVDVWVRASLRTLIELWLGHRRIDAALEDGSLRIDGSQGELRAFREWFRRSHFAEAGERPAGA